MAFESLVAHIYVLFIFLESRCAAVGAQRSTEPQALPPRKLQDNQSQAHAASGFVTRQLEESYSKSSTREGYDVHILLVADARYLEIVRWNVDSFKCYGRRHGYTVVAGEDLFVDERAPSGSSKMCGCAKNRVFFFRKHCVVACYLERLLRAPSGALASGTNDRGGMSSIIGSNQMRRPVVAFVIDADVFVGAPEVTLDKWARGMIEPTRGARGVDLVFTERCEHFELAAGLYIARATKSAVRFLREWAHFEFEHPTRPTQFFPTSDNGALHPHLCAALNRPGASICRKLWDAIVPNAHHTPAYCKVLLCVREALGLGWDTNLRRTTRLCDREPPGGLPGKVKLQEQVEEFRVGGGRRHQRDSYVAETGEPLVIDILSSGRGNFWFDFWARDLPKKEEFQSLNTHDPGGNSCPHQLNIFDTEAPIFHGDKRGDLVSRYWELYDGSSAAPGPRTHSTKVRLSIAPQCTFRGLRADTEKAPPGWQACSHQGGAAYARCVEEHVMREPALGRSSNIIGAAAKGRSSTSVGAAAKGRSSTSVGATAEGRSSTSEGPAAEGRSSTSVGPAAEGRSSTSVSAAPEGHTSTYEGRAQEEYSIHMLLNADKPPGWDECRTERGAAYVKCVGAHAFSTPASSRSSIIIGALVIFITLCILLFRSLRLVIGALPCCGVLTRLRAYVRWAARNAGPTYLPVVASGTSPSTAAPPGVELTPSTVQPQERLRKSHVVKFPRV